MTRARSYWLSLLLLGGLLLSGRSRAAAPPPVADKPPASLHPEPVSQDASAQGAPGQIAPSAAPAPSLAAPAPPVWPEVELGSVQFQADAGRVDLKGRALKGSRLRWRVGSRSGEDSCRDPSSLPNGMEACAFALPRDLPADPSALSFSLLPAAPAEIAPALAEERRFGPARILLSSVLPPAASVDLQLEPARVPLLHAEAVGSVDCEDAVCDLEDGALRVTRARTASDSLAVDVRLRPHVYLERNGQLSTTSTLLVPLQHCPVTVVSPPPFRGLPWQRAVVRLGGRCAEGGSLRVSASTGEASVERQEKTPEGLYLLVRLASVSEDQVSFSVYREGTLVGVAQASTRAMPSLVARLELPGLGTIQSVPTNRPARVRLPMLREGGRLEPLAVEGVYGVRATQDGGFEVRGVDGAAGNVSLRLGVRDPSLPASLREGVLAEVSEPVSRPLEAANVPVPLSETGERALVELRCGDGEGHSVQREPGVTSYVPFRARDTCQLILHQERLREEDGSQALHLTVSVSNADGGSRPEASVDQQLVLRPGHETRSLFLTGVEAPFDRVVVRLSLNEDPRYWAVLPEERIAAPQVEWPVVFGTDRVRLYATTAFPTGLFRVAEPQHSGILTLNAGALMRLVLLSREGAENPLCLETGVMWLGVAGDTEPEVSSRGQVAAVMGLGLSIPIANASRQTQTSINLHAWVEYEVSRQVLNQPGRAWAFVFGPSLSVGDVGINF